MSNLVEVSKDSWLMIKEQAEEVKKAGLLPTNITAAQAAIIILQGRELGIPTMRALSGMFVVNGKVAMDAKFMMGLIRERCPQAKIVIKRKDDKGCVIEASRPNSETETFSFVEADALRAGLIQKGGPWKLYPSNMYWSRAVTMMGRQLFSDILGGCGYTPEELGGDAQVESEAKEVKQNPAADERSVGPGESTRAQSLNQRILSKASQGAHRESAEPVPRREKSFDDFRKEKAALSEKKNVLTPEVVQASTDNAVGAPLEIGEIADDEIGDFDAFENPNAPVESDFIAPYWKVKILSGKDIGKTLLEVYKEKGQEALSSMYKKTLEKINQFGEEGKEIPATGKAIFEALEKCLTDLQ